MLSARIVWMRGVTPLLAPVLSSSLHLKPLTHARGKLFCSLGNTECIDSNPVDMEARVNTVFNDLCSRGVKHTKEKVSCFYQVFLDLGIEAEIIEAQLKEMPDLLDYSQNAWVKTCQVMVENNVPSLQILQSIALHPDLLNIKPSLLYKKLLQYQEFGIGKQHMLSIALSYPVMLSCDVNRVRMHLDSLKNMFPPASLQKLVKNNPNILIDDWNETMEKIMYIHKEMGLEQPHIASSSCLSHSLLHIKTRHIFLLRSGLYKKPNLLKDSQSHLRNPSLIQIMDTTNKEFTNRVARLSELEYDVFEAMMVEELEDSDDQDSDGSDQEGGGYNKRKRR